MHASAIVLQLALSQGAHAQGFDAHGAAVPPDSSAVTDPLLGWGGAKTGAPTFTLMSESQSEVLVDRLAQGDRFQDTEIVDGMVGGSLAFQTGIYRGLGVAVHIPAFYVTPNGEVDPGVALGDAGLWVPVGLFRGQTTRLGVVPFVGLPTGSDRRYLGESGLSGGTLASAAQRIGPLVTNLDAGLDYTPPTGVPEWPGGLHYRYAGSVGMVVAEIVGGHLEMRGRAGIGRDLPTVPTELLGTVKTNLGDRTVISGGAGTALTRGVGASAFHILIGISVSPGTAPVEEALVATPEPKDVRVIDDRRFPIVGATVVAGNLSGQTDFEGYVSLPPRAFNDREITVSHPNYDTEVVAVTPDEMTWEVQLARKPIPVQVSVVGPEGSLMLVEVELDGPYDPGPAQVDEAGVHNWQLEPGTWFVRMSSPGLGSQERTLVIERARVEPIRVDAVLASDVDNHSRVRVEVVDRFGRPVEDAVVALSDRDLGTTGTGGDLVVEGLGVGEQTLSVRSEKYGGGANVSLEIIDDGDEQTVQAMVDWKPGSVQVQAVDPTGEPVDATVTFLGPSNLPPRSVGSDGGEVFVLRPGTWDVEVSAAGMGTQLRTIEVTEEAGDIVVVDVGLVGDEGGDSDLKIRLRDTQGRPAAGIDVSLDGKSVGKTGPNGELELHGLKRGERKVAFGGPMLLPQEDTVDLREGLRVLDATVHFMDGATQLTATDADGKPIDATVRISGPQHLPDNRIGRDGSDNFLLLPGEWTVEVSAPGMGTQTRSLVVEDGAGIRRDMGFVLAPEGETGAVRVKVTDTEGHEVEGAAVSLNGQVVGQSEDGVVVADGIGEGRFEVGAVAEGMAAVVKKTEVSAGGETEVEIGLEYVPGAMAVDVTGPDGQPIEASVTLRAPDGSAAVMSREVDEDTVIAAKPGTYEMVVQSEGMRTQVIPVDLSSDAELNTVAVEMAPRPEDSGAAVLLKAEDEQGKALANAEVKVDGETVGRTTGAGTFELIEVGAGKAHITLVPENAAAHEETELVVDVSRKDQKAAAEVETAVVVADAKRDVAVQVTDASGNQVDAEILAVQGADAESVQLDGESGPGTMALRPGAYTITAVTETGDLATAEVVVPRYSEDAESSAYLAEADSSGTTRDGMAEMGSHDGMAMIGLRIESIDAQVSEGMVVPVRPILFDTGQHVLRTDAQPLIRDLARWLNTHREAALIEVGGHTDSVGGVVYNQQLSERRARTVVLELIEAGVAPERLEARGYGLSRPVTSNLDADARQENRRVELQVKDWNEE